MKKDLCPAEFRAVQWKDYICHSNWECVNLLFCWTFHSMIAKSLFTGLHLLPNACAHFHWIWQSKQNRYKQLKYLIHLKNTQCGSQATIKTVKQAVSLSGPARCNNNLLQKLDYLAYTLKMTEEQIIHNYILVYTWICSFILFILYFAFYHCL